MISIFGIIPVRSGSKRLPGKNLMQFCGESLLERTIHQAKKALPVSIVTSDDSEAIQQSIALGIHALLRPKELSTDTATSAEVVDHVIGMYHSFEWFCLLQVTSPLRTVEDIQTCVLLAAKHNKPVISTFNGKPNGAVYIGKTSSFAGSFTNDALQYEMPEERSVDIDTLEDFKHAEELCALQS